MVLSQTDFHRKKNMKLKLFRCLLRFFHFWSPLHSEHLYSVEGRLFYSLIDPAQIVAGMHVFAECAKNAPGFVFYKMVNLIPVKNVSCTEPPIVPSDFERAYQSIKVNERDLIINRFDGGELIVSPSALRKHGPRGRNRFMHVGPPFWLTKERVC